MNIVFSFLFSTALLSAFFFTNTGCSTLSDKTNARIDAGAATAVGEQHLKFKLEKITVKGPGKSFSGMSIHDNKPLIIDLSKLEFGSNFSGRFHLGLNMYMFSGESCMIGMKSSLYFYTAKINTNNTVTIKFMVPDGETEYDICSSAFTVKSNECAIMRIKTAPEKSTFFVIRAKVLNHNKADKKEAANTNFDTRKIICDFNKAMKSASSDNQKLENIHNAALALYNCGKYRQAADIRVKSLDLKGISNSQKITVCSRAVGEYIQGGNENKARKLCNILNTIYKNDNKAPSSIIDRAKELHRKSKYQEAADTRLKILDLKGLSGNQKAQLCTYAIYDYTLAKNYVKAYELYDRLSTIKGLEPITKAGLISSKAHSLKMEKKYKEALEFLNSEKIAGFSKPRYICDMKKIDIYEAQKNYQAVLKDFPASYIKKIIKPYQNLYFRRRANAWKYMGNFSEAIKEYESLVKTLPSGGGTAFYEIGLCYEKLKDKQKARQMFQKSADAYKAVYTNPHSQPSQIIYSLSLSYWPLIKLDKKAQINANFERILKMDDATALNKWEARMMLQNIRTIQADAINANADAVYRQKKYRKSADIRVKILDIKGLSDDEKVKHCSFAICEYALAKDYDKANELYKKLFTAGLNPSSKVTVIVRNADALKIAGKYDDAIALLNSNKTTGFDKTLRYLNDIKKADIYKAKKDYQAIIKDFPTNYIKQFPPSYQTTYYLYRAETYKNIGKTHDAIREYEKSINISSKHPHKMIRTDMRRFPHVITEAQALAGASHYADSLYQLGLLFESLQQNEKAKQMYQKSVDGYKTLVETYSAKYEKSPTPENTYNISYALIQSYYPLVKLSKKAEGKTNLEKVLEMNVSASEKKYAQKLIDRLGD